ncbi:TlpA family protein disulfide reductase [bacterium]|nr:TlpA family protein disulfide reductase [bacterium]
MGENQDSTRDSGEWKRLIHSEGSRKWIIGLGAISLVGVIVFGFQSLIFPEKAAHLSFLDTEFPNYELYDPQGDKVSTHALVEEIQSKEVLISFWATWCEPCLRELPLLERALPMLSKKGTDVLLINYDGGLAEKTRREVMAWLISERIRFNSFFDFDEHLLSHLHVHSLPFSVRVRAKDKKILWMKMGELEWEDLDY